MIRDRQNTHFPLSRQYSFCGFHWPKVLCAIPAFMRRMYFRNSEFRFQLLLILCVIEVISFFVSLFVLRSE